MSRLIDADLLGLTDMEIIMCDGDYKEALKMLIDKIEHAPTIELEQRWTPCSDRLPDTSNWVIVTDDGETTLGRRFDGRWWDVNGNKQKDVTAWQPMPESYKGGQDE